MAVLDLDKLFSKMDGFLPKVTSFRLFDSPFLIIFEPTGNLHEITRPSRIWAPGGKRAFFEGKRRFKSLAQILYFLWPFGHLEQVHVSQPSAGLRVEDPAFGHVNVKKLSWDGSEPLRNALRENQQLCYEWLGMAPGAFHGFFGLCPAIRIKIYLWWAVLTHTPILHI